MRAARRKPERYLPLAAIFLSCTHSFPCDRARANQGKIPHFPPWGALCAHGSPPCLCVRLFPALFTALLGASGGSVFVLGHPSGSAPPHILSLVSRDESLGCNTPSMPCVGLCPPLGIPECSDARGGLLQEKIHLPMIHRPSCGSWTHFASTCSCLGGFFFPCLLCTGLHEQLHFPSGLSPPANYKQGSPSSPLLR